MSATLTDAYGTPLINREVAFYVDDVRIGSAFTNIDGIAYHTYKATRTGTFYVNALFAGSYLPRDYYINDPNIVGVGFYGARATNSGYLYVTNESIVITGKFTSGATTASVVNKTTNLGNKFTFDYTVSNYDADAVDLVVTFKIPKGLEFVKAVAVNQKGVVIGNLSNAVFDKKTNTLTWNISALKYGNVTIRISLKSLKDGKYVIKPVITSEYANLKVSAGKFNINVKKLPDLIITKVKKVKDSYVITVKNQGAKASKKTTLQLICVCEKFSKSIDVKALDAGKSVKLTIDFPPKGASHIKSAIINPMKKVIEFRYKNNEYKMGRL